MEKMEMVNVKAIAGSISAPNSGSIMKKIRIKKILVAKWGKPTKNTLAYNFKKNVLNQ
jgi:hypothetical protein